MHSTASRQRAIAERLRAATAACGVAVLIVFTIASFGPLGWDVALSFAAAVAILVVAFTVMVQSGLNQRFADPSLSLPMLIAAGLATTYVVHAADEARLAASMIYILAFMFATLTQSARQQLCVALFYIGCYVTVLVLLWREGIDRADFRNELFQFTVFSLVLGWLAAFGAYVTRLRHAIRVRNRAVRQALGRIEQLAIRDELTGIYNRRYVNETLARELARCARTGESLCVCLLDLDHFKQINDDHGHAVGDAALTRFAEIIGAGLRAGDVARRFGGEEFVVVMPGTDAPGAVLCAERIRAAVEGEAFPELPETHRTTVTGGVVRARRNETPADLLSRADSALYAGKRAGRNRIVSVD